MNSNGAHVRQLTSGNGDSGIADWSPDARTIVFESDRTRSSQIYAMNPDGTGLRQLTHNHPFNQAATFSPDGTRIVWHAGQPDGSSLAIWEMTSRGRRQRVLLSGPGDFLDAGPDWQAIRS